MRFSRSRRAVLAAALASPVLLASCGGGGESIVSRFNPTRAVLIEGGGSSWGQQVASQYGIASVFAPTGGPEYSLGATPIGGGLGATTLQQRVDLALAAGVGEDDLVVLSGGVPDIVAETLGAGSVANIEAVADRMADQILRLVAGGATHVLVASAYDVGRTPRFAGTGQEATASNLTQAFNNRLKVRLAVLNGSPLPLVLFDAENLLNRIELPVNSGGGFLNFTNASAPACTGSVQGVGTVSSATCTTGAFGGNDPAVFLFYDPVYLTPYAQTVFGDEAYNVARRVW